MMSKACEEFNNENAESEAAQKVFSPTLLTAKGFQQ